jgi:precorrin-4/cobalt-precorrin-4 C11-methyltransferase
MGKIEKSQIYFVGAGPGDPELITVKGKRLIETADVIIYTGSLLNKDILSWAKPNAELYDSAPLTLEEILGLMEKSLKNGKKVVRLHDGDPSIFGALNEQIEFLEKKGISYEIVPGVSSFLAAAASLKKELTIPEISQTVILTRCEGRTPVPEREKLQDLAKHKASLVIFLSVHMIDRVVKELKEGYEEDTPCAVVYKASWYDEKIIFGRLSDISTKVKIANIKKTALILVGNFLEASGKKSKLYNKAFSHGFRRAEK